MYGNVIGLSGKKRVNGRDSCTRITWRKSSWASEGVSCNLKEISVEKPGNETIRFRNAGSLGVTLEIEKSQYEDGVFEFATAKKSLIELEKGEEKSISLEDGKIMRYTVQGCRAKSRLVRYGEIDPYDGGPDVSNTLEKYN